MSAAKFKDICLDSNDHQALADFWCSALGYQRRHVVGPEWPADWPVVIDDVAGRGPAIWLVPVPERKAGKNRMHIDVVGDRNELIALGATILQPEIPAIDGSGKSWAIMADPQGNEFCCFPRVFATNET